MFTIELTLLSVSNDNNLVVLRWYTGSNDLSKSSPFYKLRLMNRSNLSKRLTEFRGHFFSLYCIIAAFGTYFCMYAFRKPFTAATYEDSEWFGVGLKTLLIASQVAGYTLSKFFGIKFVSEIKKHHRGIAIVILVLSAELALLLFAVTPAPWNCIWLFFNGLPLGMVFGLVLGFLEGRRVSEVLAAGLCASFIVSSGFVKTVGRALLQNEFVTESWMPFFTGLLFLLPLLLFVGMLSRIPEPNDWDVLSRSARDPMDKETRFKFFRGHAVGLSSLILIYMLITVVRSLRDDFAVEIWTDLGVEDEPALFAISEFWVMFGVIFINGCFSLISNNRAAFLSSIGTIIVGGVIILSAVYGHYVDFFSPMTLIILLGVGMYLPYVAFHTTMFERMIAVCKETGNVGYLMYLADAVGYLGYVAVLIFRNLYSGQLGYLSLLMISASVVAIVSSVVTVWLLFHFYARTTHSSS